MSAESLAVVKVHDYDRNTSRSTIEYVNHFAGSIRDSIQATYDGYAHLFGTNAFCFDVYGAMCLTVAFFWTVGALYTLLDVYKKPLFLYKYKTQDDDGVTWNDVKRTAKVSVFNQMTVQFATSVGFHYLGRIRGLDSSPRVPPLTIILYHLAVFAFIQEISFYYFHRLLHTSFFYRHVHKVHHYWQAPIAIAAIYCHPLEHFLANLLPVLLGPLVMGSHRAVIAIWLIMVHIYTLNDHSGYHFPLMPSPEFHDYHHLKFNQNFGRMGFLDYFHGTSERYSQSTYAKRDKLLLSLTPMKKLVPLETKMKYKL